MSTFSPVITWSGSKFAAGGIFGLVVATTASGALLPVGRSVNSSQYMIQSSTDGAVLVNSGPTVVGGGYLSPQTFAVSLWLFNSATTDNLDPSNRMLIWTNTDEPKRFFSRQQVLFPDGLAVSMGGGAGKAVVSMRKRS